MRHVDLDELTAGGVAREQILDLLHDVAFIGDHRRRVFTLEREVVLEHALGDVQALAHRGDHFLGLTQRRAVEVEPLAVGRERFYLLLLGLQFLFNLIT